MGKEYTRDATEHGQIMIAEAIQTLASSSGGSSAIEEELIEANGYIKLSNGLIIQWGQVGGGSATAGDEITDVVTVNFQTQFTTCFGVICPVFLGYTDSSQMTGQCLQPFVLSFTNSSFICSVIKEAYSGGTYPTALWIAIGV